MGRRILARGGKANRDSRARQNLPGWERKGKTKPLAAWRERQAASGRRWLQQLGDRVAVIEDVHWPAAAVGERVRRVDAQGVVDGAQDVALLERTILGVLAAGAAAADGLAHLEAAAGDQRRHDRRPVIAAAVVHVDLRRAAELAPH